MQLIGIITLVVGAVLCVVACLIYEKAYNNSHYYVSRSKQIDLIEDVLATYKKGELKADMTIRLNTIEAILKGAYDDDNGVL